MEKILVFSIISFFHDVYKTGCLQGCYTLWFCEDSVPFHVKEKPKFVKH